MSINNGNASESNSCSKNRNGVGQGHDSSVPLPGESWKRSSDSDLQHPGAGKDPSQELPSIDIDITDYGDKPSFIDTYRRVSADIDQAKAWQRASIETASFWESYLYGVGLALRFLGKVVVFIVFALIGLALYNRVF